jgi:hypothetical protein
VPLLFSGALDQLRKSIFLKDLMSHYAECPCIAKDFEWYKPRRRSGYYKFTCTFQYQYKEYKTQWEAVDLISVKKGDTLTAVFSYKHPRNNYVKEYENAKPK